MPGRSATPRHIPARNEPKAEKWARWEADQPTTIVDETNREPASEPTAGPMGRGVRARNEPKTGPVGVVVGEPARNEPKATAAAAGPEPARNEPNAAPAILPLPARNEPKQVGVSPRTMDPRMTSGEAAPAAPASSRSTAAPAGAVAAGPRGGELRSL